MSASAAAVPPLPKLPPGLLPGAAVGAGLGLSRKGSDKKDVARGAIGGAIAGAGLGQALAAINRAAIAKLLRSRRLVQRAEKLPQTIRKQIRWPLSKLVKKGAYEPPKSLKGRGIREQLVKARGYQKGGKKRSLLATRLQMARQGASEARRRSRAKELARESTKRFKVPQRAPTRPPGVLRYVVPAALATGLAVGALRRYRARQQQKMTKAAQATAGALQPPTGLSGLGTHISRAVKQRGGTFQMMMLGIRDAPTDQFAQSLMKLTQAGRYGMARQQVIMANFPDDMRDRIIGTLDQLRAQPGIPDHYRSMTLLSAFDPR